MSTLSFRTTDEFIVTTQTFAEMIGLKNSEYVRQAVLEKNERVMREHLTALSQKLSAKHQALNEAFDDATGDGFE
jgi:hypothetical protein